MNFNDIDDVSTIVAQLNTDKYRQPDIASTAPPSSSALLRSSSSSSSSSLHRSASATVSSVTPAIRKRLYTNQIPHVDSVVHALTHGNAGTGRATAVLDGSPTGSGKTHCGAAVAAALHNGVVLACPMNLMPKWNAEFTRVGVPSVVVNYETLKRGKIYTISASGAVSKQRTSATFLIPIRDSTDTIIDFNWRITPGMLVIFDEAHVCGNPDSLNGKLLLSAKRAGARILMLSATLADSSQNFAIFGYVLGCYEHMQHARSWIRSVKRSGAALHTAVFPAYGSRIQMDQTGPNALLGNTIHVERHRLTVDVRRTIEQLWAEFGTLHRRNANLKRQHTIRKTIEEHLADGMAERARAFTQQGRSVIIYVNYRSTVAHLAQLLDTDCIIEGGQCPDVRQRNIRRFQSNRRRIIISNLTAGGVGIDLHDVHGDHPRVILMRPGTSSKQIKQGLGRANRITAQTPSESYLEFADTPSERRWSEYIGEKIAFIDDLNDVDLSPEAVKLLAR